MLRFLHWQTVPVVLTYPNGIKDRTSFDRDHKAKIAIHWRTYEETGKNSNSFSFLRSAFFGLVDLPRWTSLHKSGSVIRPSWYRSALPLHRTFRSSLKILTMLRHFNHCKRLDGSQRRRHKCHPGNFSGVDLQWISRLWGRKWGYDDYFWRR